METNDNSIVHEIHSKDAYKYYHSKNATILFKLKEDIINSDDIQRKLIACNTRKIKFYEVAMLMKKFLNFDGLNKYFDTNFRIANFKSMGKGGFYDFVGYNHDIFFLYWDCIAIPEIDYEKIPEGTSMWAYNDETQVSVSQFSSLTSGGFKVTSKGARFFVPFVHPFDLVNFPYYKKRLVERYVNEEADKEAHRRKVEEFIRKTDPENKYGTQIKY